MPPDYDVSKPPDHVCPSCGHRWPGEREFCPNCGVRVSGRRRFTWSCGVVVLALMAFVFACVGACSLYMLAQGVADRHNEYSGAALEIGLIVGVPAILIAVLLIYALTKVGRRP